MEAAREPSSYQTRQSEFEARLRELMQPYARRIEYGNLRSQPSDWETPDGHKITNFAIVYETPGGSTDQINVAYDHTTGHFTLLDEALGELETESVETAIE